MPHRPTLWIDDADALRARIATPPARIGLDTEFIRERTYWPQLALVQLALDDALLLVDPLRPGMAAVVRALLDNTACTKVMHSAGEDLVALKHWCGALPRPLFDTQVAAALCGLGAGLGYQRLVGDVTGVALGKGETRSDWMRRPLTPSQCDYAADDVRHLFALQDALAPKLAALGRVGWFEEDCARLVENVERDAPERWPHLSLRAAQYLDADGRNRLLRLLRWRDAYAREHDRPRGWILDNEVASALAREPARDAAELQQRLDAQPKAPRKLAAALWTALTTPLPDEADAPLPRTEERDRNAVRRLQDAVAARSGELGLPDGVLASRRWLELLLDAEDAGSAWPGPLSGWRRAELEPALAPLLRRAADAEDAAAPAA